MRSLFLALRSWLAAWRADRELRLAGVPTLEEFYAAQRKHV